MMATSFANVINVINTREEFTLLFGTNQTWNLPSSRELTVKLSNRVVLTPFAAKRLLMILAARVQDYEQRFGTLQLEGQARALSRLIGEHALNDQATVRSTTTARLAQDGPRLSVDETASDAALWADVTSAKDMTVFAQAWLAIVGRSSPSIIQSALLYGPGQSRPLRAGGAVVAVSGVERRRQALARLGFDPRGDQRKPAARHRSGRRQRGGALRRHPADGR